MPDFAARSGGGGPELMAQLDEELRVVARRMVRGEFDERSPGATGFVHEAIGRLEVRRSRLGRLVALRDFVEMTNREIAAARGVTGGAVEKSFQTAREWLRREFAEQGASHGRSGAATCP